MKLSLIFFLLFLQSLFAQVFEKEPHQAFIEKIIEHKSMVDYYVKISDESQLAGRPFTGYELNEISETSAERFKLRKEALSYIGKTRPLVRNKIKTHSKVPMTNENIEKIVKSLSVAVTLFDATLYSHLKINQDKKLRRLLNEKDQAYDKEGNELKSSILSLFSLKNRKQLLRAMKVYEIYFMNNEKMLSDPSLQYAHQAILSSYYYTQFKNDSNIKQLKEILNVLDGKISMSFKAQADFFAWLGNNIFYQGSKLFGNIVGGFQKRRGILYQDERFIAEVERELQPLDVLLEKTPFRLTNNFIPGYWGHTAIYLGSVDDLKAMGIWDHPLVQKHKKDIINGKLIVEALRTKVELNTLKKFSDIDDFALLRLKNPLSLEEQREHILRALSHVGKRYDFNFDVETGKTIVCSELHYRVFINIPFETTRMLGRSTINVDQVAKQALDNGSFEPVLLFLSGEKIQESMFSFFEGLLNYKIDELPENDERL